MDRIVFNITPETGVSQTTETRMVFIVPEDCPICCGLPRRSDKQPLVEVKTMKTTHPDLYEALGGDKWQNRRKKKIVRYGCPHSLTLSGLQKKNRIIRMQAYRKKLFELAKEVGFELPIMGWALYFYLPMPLRWSDKKRKEMQGQPNLSKPDCKNLLFLFEDSLSKTDERNAVMSGLGKFWINKTYIDENGKKQKGEGYIEVLLNQPIHNPYNVKFINQDEQPAKRKWVKKEPEKKRAPRKPKPLTLREDKIK